LRQVTFNPWSYKKTWALQRSHVIWLTSVIPISIVGTFAIINIINHFTQYFKRSKKWMTKTPYLTFKSLNFKPSMFTNYGINILGSVVLVTLAVH
jgi:hypothetical protein